MKTLFISPCSPEISIGGIERHIKNLIDYCCHNSKEVIFLLPSLRQEGCEERGSVKIIRKDFLKIDYKKFFDKKKAPRQELKKKATDFFACLQKLIKEEKIDIVNVQDFHVALPPIFSLMLNMVCFSENVPVILTMHSFVRSDLQKSLSRDLFWEKILCVSKSVTGDCFTKGIAIDNLYTQYLGVNTGEFRPGLNESWIKKEFNIPANSKIILHASRIINETKDILKEKGIIALLDAFSQLHSKYENLVLAIAIATPPKSFKKEFYESTEKLKGYIQLNNLENSVVFKEVKLENMPLAYNGSDIFVLASENETFGQVYLEAMACGVPVVGTNVGGIPEIITDGFNGFLVAPGNPSVLAQKIEELLNDEQLKKSFISNGFKVVRKKFSAEKQFSNMFSYLNRLSSLDSVL